MKHLLLSLSLLATLSACSKSEAPAPATLATPPAPAPVVYTDAAGNTAPISSYTAYSVTATPGSQQRERRAVVIRALLPNGSTLDATYTYMGRTYIGGAGAMPLDEPVLVVNYGGQLSPRTSYQAAGFTTGTLVSEAGPNTVSGTYTGPLVAGGGAVRLTFSKLSF